MGAYSSRIIYSVLFFLMASVLLVVFKPKQMFDEEGQPKPFGVGPGRTLFSLGTAILLLAILSFYAFSMAEMVAACARGARGERAAAASRNSSAAAVAPSFPYVSPLPNVFPHVHQPHPQQPVFNQPSPLLPATGTATTSSPYPFLPVTGATATSPPPLPPYATLPAT